MKFIKYFSDIWILCVILFMPFVLFWKIDRLQTDIEKNLGQKPVIIYQVDNAGGIMSGTITGKELVDGRYTVDAGSYGKFLVTQEQYESLEIGDEIPDYLKKRGS